MVDSFEVGKFYVFKKENKMPIYRDELWFNEYMLEWLDGKPRRCISVDCNTDAIFERIKGGQWTYQRAMKYFYLYKSPYVQEEMEL